MTKTSTSCCLLVVLLAGCGALLDKAEPMNVRYFTPVLEPSPHTGAASQALPLRLGRIESSDHLRERIAFRASEHEVGYYEGFRWTEQPDQYFRRALGRELFETQRFAHVVAGVAPTLEAELVAFEELREKKAVRVEARVLVHDGRRVLLEQTFRVEESRGEETPGAVTEALSRALQKCVSQISAEVGSALSGAAVPAATSRSASGPAAVTPS
jgi:cholesterol transport system auxiliary component